MPPTSTSFGADIEARSRQVAERADAAFSASRSYGSQIPDRITAWGLAGEPPRTCHG